MKRNIIIATILMIISATVKAQSNDTIDIEVTSMMPMKYPTRMLSGSYNVTLCNDSIDIHLPYIGEINSPGFNDDGLNFKEPATITNVRTKKKKSGTRTETTIETRHKSVRYNIILTTWGAGSMADINVLPGNGSQCSYTGTQR